MLKLYTHKQMPSHLVAEVGGSFRLLQVLDSHYQDIGEYKGYPESLEYSQILTDSVNNGLIIVKDFGWKLEQFILKNSSSVSAWCKDNGFPQSTIQEYIKGTKKPGWEMVQKLADALDVSTEDLRG